MIHLFTTVRRADGKVLIDLMWDDANRRMINAADGGTLNLPEGIGVAPLGGGLPAGARP